MEGYFDLVLGQLAHWRDNARNLYGARGFLAPSRTDGEYGHMLHFNSGSFPGEAWTGGADWLLYPLLEHYQITGDADFLRNKLGPALWWKLVPAATSGYYRLVNVSSGLCADVQSGSTADGAKVIQWPAGSGANQEWQPVGV